MASRKRKPLADITDMHNLTPLSVLRELVNSNGTCKPPVSILKSNSNSTNHNFCPQSSDRSNTSIGSSSVGATFTSKTVQFQQPSPSISPAYTRRHNIEKCNKEREAHLVVSHTSVEKRKDKGKAIAVPFTSSASDEMKENQHKICNMAPTNKDKFVSNSHSSGKSEKGKAILSSSAHASGNKSETGKNIAETSSFSLEKINDKNKGILNRTRSSTVKIKEAGNEYLNPSSSSVGGAKDRQKFVDITNFLPDKAKGKEKVILEPSNIRGSSASVAVISQPLKKMKTTEKKKKKNVVGVSSCPPMTRIKKLQNDLDEAGDVKYLNSWTAPQANVRKKRCSRTENTSELPEEFVREQKAYFDDIDNFELPVEEVSEDELD